MLPHLIERGHLAIQVGSRGSGHPNHYQPLEKSANGGVIESANGGAIAEKPKAPFSRIKAPSETKKAPTGALNTVEHNEHSKSAPSARSTARVDRGNVTETEKTTDDAPHIQRAPGGALIETVEAQPQPSRVNKKMGPPVNVDADDAWRWVQFLNVVRVWKPEFVGDEAAAYEVFHRLMAAGRRLHAVIDDVTSMMLDYGDDPPSLAGVLMTIERNP